MNALKAKEFYRRDVQYIVRNGKALIINEVNLYIIASVFFLTILPASLLFISLLVLSYSTSI